MSQTETGKATAAGERTEAARSFVRTVKAATRRKYTSEEKILIVLEGFRREVAVSDLCRREGSVCFRCTAYLAVGTPYAKSKRNLGE